MATITTKNFIFEAETDGASYSVRLDIQAGTGTVHTGFSGGALKTTLVFDANQDRHDSWWSHASVFGSGRDTSLNAEITAA